MPLLQLTPAVAGEGGPGPGCGAVLGPPVGGVGQSLVASSSSRGPWRGDDEWWRCGDRGVKHVHCHTALPAPSVIILVAQSVVGSHSCSLFAQIKTHLTFQDFFSFSPFSPGCCWVTCVVEAWLGVRAGGVEAPHPGRGEQLGGLALGQGLDAVLGAALRVARVAPPHQVPGTTQLELETKAIRRFAKILQSRRGPLLGPFTG